MKTRPIRSRTLLAQLALLAPAALESFMLRDNIPALRQRHDYLPALPVHSPEAILIRLVHDGDEEGALLHARQSGLDVNARDEVGLSLLHHAAQAGYVSLMQALKMRGAAVDACSITGESVANFTINCNARRTQEVREGSAPQIPVNRIDEVMAQLLEWQVDLGRPDSEGNTPAMNAALIGDEARLRQLREAGAPLANDSDGRRLDTMVAHAGLRHVSRLLLRWGFDPREAGDVRLTPREALDMVINATRAKPGNSLYGHREMLVRGEVIAEARAVAGLPLVGADLTVVFNNIDAFRRVYSNSFERDGVYSDAALTIIGRMAGYEAPGQMDERLLYASRNGDEEGVVAAYAAGARPQACDALGRTPVMQAVLGRKPATLVYHRQMGADFNAQDCLLQTALMYAVLEEDAGLVYRLLAAQANPLLRNHEGMTARQLWLLRRCPAPARDEEAIRPPAPHAPGEAGIVLPGFILALEQQEQKWQLAVAKASQLHATASAKPH